MDSFLSNLAAHRLAGRDVVLSDHRIHEELQNRYYRSWNIDVEYSMAGSISEGLPLLCCNDGDYMCTDPHIFVHVASDDNCLRENILEVEETVGDPCYLKLKINTPAQQIPPIFSNCIKDENGKKYVESSSFPQSFFDVKVPYHKFGRENHDRHGSGPNIKREGHVGAIPFDHVAALICSDWPPCAKAFLTRQTGKWLWEAIKDNKCKCHVVPVGPPDAHDRYLQWRWSFSLAEKLIIWKMDDHQIQALYMIKALVNQLKEQNAEAYDDKRLCSYYVKTAVLSTCEEYECTHVQEQNKYTPGMSIDILRKVLDNLITAYSGCHLIHFFIPEQNLIKHISKTVCTEVVSDLKMVREDLCRALFRSLRPLDTELRLVRDVTEDHLTQLTCTVSDCEDCKKLRSAASLLAPGGELYTQRQTWEFNNIIGIVLGDHECSHLVQLTEKEEKGYSLLEDAHRDVLDNMADYAEKKEPNMIAFLRNLTIRWVANHHNYLMHLGKNHDFSLQHRDRCSTILLDSDILHVKCPTGFQDEGLYGLSTVMFFQYFRGDFDQILQLLALPVFKIFLEVSQEHCRMSVDTIQLGIRPCSLGHVEEVMKVDPEMYEKLGVDRKLVVINPLAAVIFFYWQCRRKQQDFEKGETADVADKMSRIVEYIPSHWNYHKETVESSLDLLDLVSSVAAQKLKEKTTIKEALRKETQWMAYYFHGQ